MTRADDAKSGDETEPSDPLLRETAGIDDATSGAGPVHRAPGSRIGRFVLRDELGRGGMGVVYRAFDDALNRSVALKVLPALGAGSQADDAKARLFREARAAASLEHPHVVAIYDVGEHEGAAFIAMELVVGQSLRERMREPSTLDEKIGWLWEIAGALGAAHDNGIVHRDVKPENVMIKRDGHVKVLDFGIARQAASPVDPNAPTEASGERLGTLTVEGALVGTPRYMAPEQLHGDKLDGRCDQFAWGVVAYELFAGTPPWDESDAVSLIASTLGKEPPPLAEVAPEVPSTIAAIVARALSKSPKDRFATMNDVVEAMKLPEAAAQPLVRAPKPRRFWAIAVGAALALGGALFATRHLETPKPASAPSAAAPSQTVPSEEGPGIAVTDLPLPHSDVPQALAAYKAGMQVLRDGGDYASNFKIARRLDPDMGAAYLRSADWESSNEGVELVLQAAERRSSLPEHEALLLDALLPCVQSRAGEDHWCVERVRRLTQDHPRDAEFAHRLGDRLSSAGRIAEWRDAEHHAIELDPGFARARIFEIEALTYLGDIAGAKTALAACSTISPSFICLRNKGIMEERLGQAAELEATAHAMLGMSPNNWGAFFELAQATACLDRPRASVQAAVDRVIAAQPAAAQPGARLEWAAKVAAHYGDFAAAAEVNRQMSVDPARRTFDMKARSKLAQSIISIAFESGQPGDAADAAQSYLDVRDTLFGDRSESDDAVATHAIWPMLKALRRAHRIRDSEVTAARDRFIDDWRPRLGPGYQPYLWLATFATLAETPDDARQALAALPSFNGLPKEFYLSDMPDELYIGRLYLLADRVDEAIPWLAEAAHACRLGDPQVVWASLDLGKALEKKSDKAGACDAYAAVLKRWGDAKPKSVTADEAKKRSHAFGCGH